MLEILKQIKAWREARRFHRRSLDLSTAWLRGDDEPPPVTLTNAFTQSTWIYACVSAIAQQVAQTPLRFRLDGESGRQPSPPTGPLLELFNQPHPQLDRFLFWELVVSWLLLRGQAFVVGLDREGQIAPVNPPRAVPSQLMILHPDRLTRFVVDHQLAGYRYQAGREELVGSQALLPEEVLSVRLADPFDMCGGQSPATVAALAAQTDYAAAQFMKGLMLSNADTGLFVTMPHEPGPDQREQILALLRERRRKAGTPDRPLFLWAGAKIEKPALSMVDIQFLENRKFSRQEICAIYKTPQEILGFTEDANRAVAEAVRLNWIENTVSPLCERLMAAFAPLVRGRASDQGPRLAGWFDIEALPLMQKARRERFRAARQGFEMGVPLGVLNRLFALGLPALPHEDIAFLPGSFQRVEENKASVANLGPEPARAQAARPALPPAPALRSRLCRFFFEQRGRVLARLFSGVTPLLELPAENERLCAAMAAPGAGSLAPDLRACLADINETTGQQLADALAEALSTSPEERAALVRQVFQRAARERAPLLAPLLQHRSEPSTQTDP